MDGGVGGKDTRDWNMGSRARASTPNSVHTWEPPSSRSSRVAAMYRFLSGSAVEFGANDYTYVCIHTLYICIHTYVLYIHIGR